MTQERFTKIMTRRTPRAARHSCATSPTHPDCPSTSTTSTPRPSARCSRPPRKPARPSSPRNSRPPKPSPNARATAEREAQLEAREQAAAARDRETKIRGALARLGAYDDDQDDAYALLKDKLPADADDTAITEAATALKTRRGDFFGTTPAPQALPPAPGGAPPAGPARTPISGKDAINEAARKRAEEMGLRRPEAA